MAQNAQRQRANAQSKTAFQNLRSKTDVNTKRMAGLALAAMLGPSVVSMFDGNEDNIISDLGSGMVTAGGLLGGGYLGLRGVNIKPEDLDAFKRQEISRIKSEVRELGKTDPAAAVELFSRMKGEMMDDVSPIDPARAKIFNQSVKVVPELGHMVAEADLLNRTPRQLRGVTKGAALGALAAALPAYLATRNSEE
jgi:hypothetical protein